MEEHDANNLQSEIIELTCPHQSQLLWTHLHNSMPIINGNFIGKYTLPLFASLL